MKTIPAKTMLSRVKHGESWFGCDYNMNIYRGCCHGCIYCDSRSDCYRIENFDEVAAKENALFLLAGELSHKILHGVVGTGAMSDPYNPFERTEELTRGTLKLFDRYHFGVHIVTKSDLIIRDIDLLQKIAAHSPVCACLTVTTFDDKLCKIIEPHVSASSRRFSALGELSKSGIYAGILLMPVLPFINDTWKNVAAIVDAASQNGVKFIYPAFGMTLRDGQREYFYEKLSEFFPGIGEKYVRRFGAMYNCASPNAPKIYEKFSKMCGERGILFKMCDIIASYKQESSCEQMRFF